MEKNRQFSRINRGRFAESRSVRSVAPSQNVTTTPESIQSNDFNLQKYASNHERKQNALTKESKKRKRFLRRSKQKSVKPKVPKILIHNSGAISFNPPKFIRDILLFCKKHQLFTRIVSFVVAAILLLTIFYTAFNDYFRQIQYKLSPKAEALIVEKIPGFGEKLQFDAKEGLYDYNKDYSVASEGVAGQTFGPKFTAKFRENPNDGIDVVDPSYNVSFTLKPKFRLLKPLKDENRLIYKIAGKDAAKVISLGATGYKEDIILEQPYGDSMEFGYELQLPDSLEARVDRDGSLGIYGPENTTILGEVSTGTDKDAELLKNARKNAEKTKLVFRMPTPFIKESGNKIAKHTVHYELVGNMLTVKAEELKDLHYPVTIDPTVYIETAAKLMRGNNETNTDFDVDNELIQKSQTTGARIDAWQGNLDMSDPTWDIAAATAGGYIYRSGGRTGEAGRPQIVDQTETQESGGSSSFTMDMPSSRPAGDLYIALMCHDGTGAITPPSGGGWTEYADLREHAAYYKVGTDEGGGNEASTYTWTGGNEKWGGVIIRVTNYDSADPVSGTPGTGSSASNAVPVFPATTPDNDNTLVIRAVGADNDEPSATSWVPSGHTKIASGGPTGNQDCAYATASLDSSPSSGVSTGTATLADSSINDTYGASTIAINPPTGTSPATQTGLNWAKFNSSTLAIESPNPGTGACSGWCTDSAYDLPSARRGHSMVAYNGYLYAIGGLDGSGNRVSTIYIAKLGANGEPQLWHPTDPDKDNWVYWYSDTGLSSGTARSYLGAIAANNRIYLLGGETNSSPGGVTTVERADILPNGILGSWTTSGMQAIPSGAGTHMHSVQFYNNNLYILGGFEGVKTSSSNLRDTVYYSRLNNDGTMNSWQSTSSFATARGSFGGSMSYIWGAYIYIGGGCDAVNGSGYCTSISGDVEIASINADGSLDSWRDMGNLDNSRIGYSLIGWQGGLYRLGGCTSQNASTGECDAALADVDYGVINPAGEVSTVNITEPSGTSPCNGGSPQNCDLPPTGDGAGQGGQMLNAPTILNGFLYVIGGCTNYSCSQSSGNVSYVSIASDGSMQAPSSCGGTSYGAWCVDSTNRVNGTTGVSAAGITVFNNRIYVVGGIDETSSGTQAIYYNSTNSDGSLAGAWSSTTFGTAGISGEIAYTYAFARANPASAGTNPGNLYIFGGCGDISASAGCASSNYRQEVYKCNIAVAGSINGCTTSGQLQIDSTPGYGSSTDGLGIHSGTVYAGYIFLVGGYSQYESDKDDVIYAKIDNSNNIVAADGGSDWIESPNKLSTGRRRGWAFGYNGHIYAVGGYDASGGGIIPFIEWSKMDVSDGSIDSFVTSSVEINQRWGLSMAVGNAYAYVIGGCDVGASPGSCSSFEPSVQTFQLYNNDSGTVADFTAQSDQTFTASTDRWGASSAILNGYIYVAGGCTSATDCTDATNDVQYAPLDAYGNVGTWVQASDHLPTDRAWGKLRAAGGSLYYIGGQDDSGDEKSEVYYVTPETSGSAESVFRTTTYKFASGEFTGTTYTLGLNNDLSENYFTMISGAGDTAGTQYPDDASIRVDGDPFGNLGTTTNSDEILLSRGASGTNWVGTVTVVECLTLCNTSGFRLKQVVDYSIASGTASALQSVTTNLNEDHTSNTVPLGGYYGGGMQTGVHNAADFGPTLGVRIQKSSTNQLTIERYGGGGRTPDTGDITIYVVEWGSDWTVQEANFVDWNAGNTNVNNTSDYTTQSISSVTRNNSWLWKSPGTSDHNGLGSGAFGKVMTLGDGVNENSSETTVALANQQSGYVKRDTVYVMSNSSLANDYRFKSVGSYGTSTTQTVDSATGSETYATNGNITSTEGYRTSMWFHGDNGTGTAYTRVHGWSSYHTASTTITADKAYSGNNNGGWWQSTDYAGFSYTPSDGDLANWHQASNGLPADRTRFGADVWNDRLFVAGGYDDSGTATSTVYVSPQLSSGGDISSAWTSETGFSVARAGLSLTAYANNLYLFGGYDGSNYLSDVQFTQINSDGTLDSWSYTRSLPVPLSDSEAISANGYMYLVGGRTAASTCLPRVLMAPISANTTIATGNNPTGLGEWFETNTRYSGDRYGAAVAYSSGRFYTMGGGCSSPLSSNRHYQSAVNSQPQIALYSRMIDTDTDVFPNSWLLNGIDNSIGARWQVRYRSMNDTDGVATDCGTADMSTWGQETDFGDVTLGNVETYTPLDGSGSNINCARYFYFYVTIDASKTFGYPEDVDRGPTITDLSLFFTSDPSKRLRHGKTFTGGEQQPLDTPCRQGSSSPGDPNYNCPLP